MQKEDQRRKKEEKKGKDKRVFAYLSRILRKEGARVDCCSFLFGKVHSPHSKDYNIYIL